MISHKNQRIKRKVRTKKPTKAHAPLKLHPLTEILFWTLVVIAAIDLLILTPILYMSGGFYESTPLHRWGLEHFGLPWLYLSFPMLMFGLFALINLMEMGMSWFIRIHGQDQSYRCIFSATICGSQIIQFLSAVINNTYLMIKFT